MNLNHFISVSQYAEGSFVNDANNPTFEAFRDIVGFLRVCGYKVSYVKDMLRISGFDEDKKRIVLCLEDSDGKESAIIVTIINEDYRFKHYSIKVDQMTLEKE